MSTRTVIGRSTSSTPSPSSQSVARRPVAATFASAARVRRSAYSIRSRAAVRTASPPVAGHERPQAFPSALHGRPLGREVAAPRLGRADVGEQQALDLGRPPYRRGGGPLRGELPPPRRGAARPPAPPAPAGGPPRAPRRHP